MKRLYEYKVFNALQDPENVKFLDKVKKENPNLYSRYLNIVINKGLEVAKEKYKEYDPEYIKKQKEEEKEERRRISARISYEKSREYKEKLIKSFLDEKKELIDEINNKINTDNAINEISEKIEKDKNISKYVKESKSKKKITNILFKMYSSDFSNLKNYFDRINIPVIELNYVYTISASKLSNKSKSSFINITQRFNVDFGILNYSISCDIPRNINYEQNLNLDFFHSRHKNIVNLRDTNLTKSELFDIIDKLSYYLSDKYYDDWKVENDMSIFNL